MRMIRPKVTGAEQVTIAEEQPEYLTVTAARTTSVLTRGDRSYDCRGLLFAFEPNADERKRIAAGEDIYINLLTFDEPMQPIMVMCGKKEAAAAFGLGVEE